MIPPVLGAEITKIEFLTFDAVFCQIERKLLPKRPDKDWIVTEHIEYSHEADCTLITLITASFTGCIQAPRRESTILLSKSTLKHTLNRQVEYYYFRIRATAPNEFAELEINSVPRTDLEVS